MPDPSGAEGCPPGSPPDLVRVQELFDAALDEPVCERQAFLEGSGVDVQLRDEVWSLLVAHAAEGPLDQMAAAIARVTRRPGDDRQAAEGDEAPPIGPYRALETLGEGGMARVYRGRRGDDEGAPWVAVKVLRPDADSVRVRRRFMAERQILARLEHDNIARYLDDGLTPEGLPYLVTELVVGDRLDRYLERKGVDLPGRLDLFLQVCGAVEYAHRRGVVHRDLKPDNVLVTDDGQLRLLDFGIAKILDRSAFPGIGGPTTSGVHVLTLSYASPEQLSGGPITPASDIYQLGLLLLKIVTGKVVPVHQRSVEPLDIDFTPAESMLPSAGIADLDSHRLSALRSMVVHALRIHPDDRPASVGELIRVTQDILSPSEAGSWSAPGPRRPGDHRSGLGPLALVLVLGLVGLVLAALLLMG
ncbi:MAG: serine/threonine protein kinase [Gemmatimonadetes bacterium]|nr:serine/threonine protein kinase [Gemmatimonadota bacterium]NNL31384.1 serine/threonine protein kinase [Gemmatimonadota bacterium]